MVESGSGSLFCCGPGSTVRMETRTGEKFSDLRVDQALGSELRSWLFPSPPAVPLPEESRVTMGVAEGIEVKDIAGIIQELIQGIELGR